jgi:hypothetical protein
MLGNGQKILQSACRSARVHCALIEFSELVWLFWTAHIGNL